MEKLIRISGRYSEEFVGVSQYTFRKESEGSFYRHVPVKHFRR